MNKSASSVTNSREASVALARLLARLLAGDPEPETQANLPPGIAACGLVRDEEADTQSLMLKMANGTFITINAQFSQPDPDVEVKIRVFADEAMTNEIHGIGYTVERHTPAEEVNPLLFAEKDLCDKALFNKYQGLDMKEHPLFPFADWVATHRGYWNWVEAQIEEAIADS